MGAQAGSVQSAGEGAQTKPEAAQHALRAGAVLAAGCGGKVGIGSVELSYARRAAAAMRSRFSVGSSKSSSTQEDPMKSRSRFTPTKVCGLIGRAAELPSSRTSTTHIE